MVENYFKIRLIFKMNKGYIHARNPQCTTQTYNFQFNILNNGK